MSKSTSPYPRVRRWPPEPVSCRTPGRCCCCAPPQRPAWTGTVGGAGAVAQAAGAPRSRQDRARSGGRARGRRGLPGRYRAAARRARGVRAGRLRPDGVPADRRLWPPTRRQRCRRSTRPGPRPAPRVWTLAGDHAPDHDIDAGDAAGHRPRRHPGHRALGEGTRGADVQTRLRVPSVVRVRRPRRRGTGEPSRLLLRPGNAGSNTAADHITVVREALAQLPGHRPGTPARPEGADPHRRRRRHPRVPGLADRAAAVVLGRVRPARRTLADLLDRIPDRGVDPGLRRRRRDPRRRLGRRTHRPARPVRLAGRDAGDRPQGTTPPRRAAAVHRRRRASGHRVRHQHPARATRRPGAAAPPPGPRRGPDPHRRRTPA